MLFIDMNMMNNGDDREEVGMMDPDREFPGGERGGRRILNTSCELRAENAAKCCTSRLTPEACDRYSASE